MIGGFPFQGAPRRALASAARGAVRFLKKQCGPRVTGARPLGALRAALQPLP